MSVGAFGGEIRANSLLDLLDVHLSNGVLAVLTVGWVDGVLDVLWLAVGRTDIDWFQSETSFLSNIHVLGLGPDIAALVLAFLVVLFSGLLVVLVTTSFFR